MLLLIAEFTLSMSEKYNSNTSYVAINHSLDVKKQGW